jgi:hypothetical protein
MAESTARTDYTVLLGQQGSSPAACVPPLPVSLAPSVVGEKEPLPSLDLPHWTVPPGCASDRHLQNEGKQEVEMIECNPRTPTADVRYHTEQ